MGCVVYPSQNSGMRSRRSHIACAEQCNGLLEQIGLSLLVGLLVCYFRKNALGLKHLGPNLDGWLYVFLAKLSDVLGFPSSYWS